MDRNGTWEAPAGPLRYIDVGAGPPIVFVHGNPSSADEYVPAIATLRREYRCIAPDHLGFGRSAKPQRWDHLPASHAANLAGLLDDLDLVDVTLVVGDWGGPIGLSWALDHPERIRRLVLTNTWMWPVDDRWWYRGFSAVWGGPVGRAATRRWNAFARLVVPRVWGSASPLTPSRRAAFADVHRTPDERDGMWVLPREIIGSSALLADLWTRRRTFDRLPMDLVWGLRDLAFRADVLDRWVEEFPHASVTRVPDAGHFVALEATEQLVEILRARPAGSGHRPVSRSLDPGPTRPTPTRPARSASPSARGRAGRR